MAAPVSNGPIHQPHRSSRLHGLAHAAGHRVVQAMIPGRDMPSIPHYPNVQSLPTQPVVPYQCLAGAMMLFRVGAEGN